MPVRKPVFWDNERRRLEYRDQTGWNRLSLTVTGGGGGGSSDHATLSNLTWTSSAHTGTASRLAGFDGGGAAAYYQIGVDVQAYDLGLANLAALASTGIVVATGANTWTTRTITAGLGITIANGDGVSGNPTITSSRVDPIFGDGFDGDVTIAGTTTLTRDMYYDDLDIPSPYQVTADGYRVNVRGTLSGGGYLQSFAGNPSASSGGNSATPGVSVGAGGNGGNGGNNANGVNGQAIAAVWSQRAGATGEPLAGDGTTGRGGSGGISGTGRTGGAAGTITLPPSNVGWTVSTLHLGIVFASNGQTRLTGGSGGGGGGSDSAFGGGGGGGAGNLVVNVRIIDSSGGLTLRAKGAPGANGTGTNSGGGGGGAGGKIFVTYQSAPSGTPTTDVTGGAGGSKTGSGVAGVQGNSGHAEFFNLL